MDFYIPIPINVVHAFGEDNRHLVRDDFRKLQNAYLHILLVTWPFC